MEYTLSFNFNGNYIKCLNNLNSRDPIVSDYIEAKQLAGILTPSLTAAGLLYKSTEEDFKNEIIKRIIAVEFFLKF
jgi:hypothetical protein